MEIWKDVVGYEGHYMVSNMGRVKALRRLLVCNRCKRIYPERLLKPHLNANKGYLQITLTKNPKSWSTTVHRVVADAFVPKPREGLQVNHKDGNKLNNNADNLEWVTPKDNIRHAWRNGLFKPRRGEDSSSAKITEKDVLYIRSQRGIKNQKQLGQEFGLNPSVISGIQLRNTWKHI